MDSIGVILVLAGGVVVALLIALGVLNQRKTAAKYREKLSGFGFRPVENPPADMVDRLIHLKLSDSARLTVRNLYYHRDLECDMYLLDMWSSDSESSQKIHEGAVAVVASGLQMPRFTLFPKVVAEGKLGELANVLLSKIQIPGKRDVPIEIDEKFAQRYRLMGEDVDAVRNFFNPQRLEILNDTAYWMIEAQGDGFLFDERRYEPGNSTGNVTVEAKIRDALSAFQCLRESHSSG